MTERKEAELGLSRGWRPDRDRGQTEGQTEGQTDRRLTGATAVAVAISSSSCYSREQSKRNPLTAIRACVCAWCMRAYDVWRACVDG